MRRIQPRRHEKTMACRQLQFWVLKKVKWQAYTYVILSYNTYFVRLLKLGDDEFFIFKTCINEYESCFHNSWIIKNVHTHSIFFSWNYYCQILKILYNISLCTRVCAVRRQKTKWELNANMRLYYFSDRYHYNFPQFLIFVDVI